MEIKDQPFFSFSIALNASCPFGFDAPISASPSAVLDAAVNAGAFLSLPPSLALLDLGRGGGRNRAVSGACGTELELDATRFRLAGGKRWVAGRRAQRTELKEKGLLERSTSPTACAKEVVRSQLRERRRTGELLTHICALELDECLVEFLDDRDSQDLGDLFEGLLEKTLLSPIGETANSDALREGKAGECEKKEKLGRVGRVEKVKARSLLGSSSSRTTRVGKGDGNATLLDFVTVERESSFSGGLSGRHGVSENRTRHERPRRTDLLLKLDESSSSGVALFVEGHTDVLDGSVLLFKTKREQASVFVSSSRNG